MKILLTGGTGGIGLSFVKKYYKTHDITVICRDLNKGNELIKKYQINIIVLDLSNYNDIIRSFQNLENYDILINNAGMSATNKKIKIKNHEINKCLMVNLIAPYLLTEYLCQKNKVKKVISVNSITHWLGNIPNFSNNAKNCYSNSKFALMALHQHWNIKYPEITFISVNPGYVDTGIWHPNAPLENIHKYLRKLFALTPDESIIVFKKAIESRNNNYLSVNRDSNFILFLAQKISLNIILLIDFLGKLFFYHKNCYVNTINPRCLSNKNIKNVIDFCKKVVE